MHLRSLLRLPILIKDDDLVLSKFLVSCMNDDLALDVLPLQQLDLHTASSACCMFRTGRG
jgi:hypothetical protein